MSGDYSDIVNQLQNETDIVKDEEKKKDDNSTDNTQILNRKLKSQKVLIDNFRKKTSVIEAELKEMKRNNGLLSNKLEEVQQVNENETDDEKKQNVSLREQCAEWKAKYVAQTVVVAQKIKENERLRELFEETNESKTNLQEELQKMAKKNKNLQRNIEMASLDYSQWEEWESRQVFLFLMNIKDGILEKYANDIESFLNESDVKGTDLATFEMNDIKDLGITVFAERKIVLQEIKQLIQGLSLNPNFGVSPQNNNNDNQDNDNNAEIEEGPTAYI